ncbi:MAG: 3-carboxy-cis,cis-muconate cycloisomerase [Pseudomonadota bacterium]
MTNALTSNGLFGSLLHDPETAALFEGAACLRRMLAFEAAWTRGLAQLGLAEREEAEAASRVISSFSADLEALGSGTERDGVPVPALVEALRAAAGPEAAPAIHSGATSQDVLDTALVLTLREAGEILRRRLAALLQALDRLEAAQGPARITGRTRMQAALPIPAAARIRAWAAPLRTQAARLDRLLAEGLPLQYGGAVGLRDLPEGRGEGMAAILSRELALPDPGRAWHADRTPLLDFGHLLTSVAGALGKMGQDVALMAQQGVDDIGLAGGGGSSAMPHKRNPVLAETLVTLARHVGGQQGVLAQAMVHEQERSGAAWMLEWMTLPPMTEATGAALRHAATLVSRIERIGPPEGGG